MRKWVVGGLALVLCLAIGLMAAWANVETHAVHTLDSQFQRRFATIDGESFGLSRIPTEVRHNELLAMRPETVEEKTAVAALKAAGRDAVFLVAGRPALARALAAGKVSQETPGGRAFFVRTIGGPVYLTGRAAAPVPDEAALLPEVAKAFQALEKGEHHEFRSGAWKVVARPVRASSQGCLGCHKNPDGSRPKLGDVLGIALYGTSRAGDG